MSTHRRKTQLPESAPSDPYLPQAGIAAPDQGDTYAKARYDTGNARARAQVPLLTIHAPKVHRANSPLANLHLSSIANTTFLLPVPFRSVQW